MTACDLRSAICDSKLAIRFRPLGLLAGWMAWLALPAMVLACPTCKEALFDPTQAQQVLKTAQGYAMSIGLLIGTPLLLVGGVATLIVRHARRQGTRRSEESELTP